MSETINKFLRNDKRTINAWAFFDWANSAYALTISVAIFPAYYTAYTLDEVSIFGFLVSNTALYAFAISAAYLLLALFSPLLSGIADYGGKRMFFMRFFTALGSFSCISLAFFEGMDMDLAADALINKQQILIATIFFMLATMGFAGGLVFYNSYLPDITTEDQYDRVSAKGFAYGFTGSVLLLLLNLAIILNPEFFHLKDATSGPRIAFIMVGLWWMGFALIPFKRLPQDEKGKIETSMVNKGFQEIRKVWKEMATQRNLKLFLMSFFFYSAGVQTVLFLAATFAEKELNFSAGEMITVILVLQIVAIAGVYTFAAMSKKVGNKWSLLTMLTVWTVICFLAYFVQEKDQFYAIAAAVGLVMGGIQSLSRSTYSKLIPEDTNDTTSYFSFYDILEKLAIVSGTLIFGIVDQLMGMRHSILALSFFFVVGLLILTTVKIKHEKVVV